MIWVTVKADALPCLTDQATPHIYFITLLALYTSFSQRQASVYFRSLLTTPFVPFLVYQMEAEQVRNATCTHFSNVFKLLPVVLC